MCGEALHTVNQSLNWLQNPDTLKSLAEFARPLVPSLIGAFTGAFIGSWLSSLRERKKVRDDALIEVFAEMEHLRVPVLASLQIVRGLAKSRSILTPAITSKYRDEIKSLESFRSRLTMINVRTVRYLPKSELLARKMYRSSREMILAVTEPKNRPWNLPFTGFDPAMFDRIDAFSKNFLEFHTHLVQIVDPPMLN